MCARLIRFSASATLVAVVLAACGNERTGTAFCRQLAREIPAIAQPITTKSQAKEIVERYRRLLDVSPLAIEKDVRTVVEVLDRAFKVDTEDAAAMQRVADAAYASNQAALNVRDWAKNTCAVDISTGSTIVPPRTVPPTTLPPATAPVTTAAP